MMSTLFHSTYESLVLALAGARGPVSPGEAAPSTGDDSTSAGTSTTMEAHTTERR
jgi:hypothetical protein